MTKFALLGDGFIGKVEANNVAAHPRAELQYVYEINTEAAEQLASPLGAKIASSAEEIWKADDVAAVLIASSTNTHADLLSGAIQAHKPAYCEKPIDLNMDRVKAVVQEAYHTNIPIMIGFSRRFDSNHLGVREAIQNGTIGKVEMMHLTSRAQEPPPISYVKVSGGQLRDQTIHFFDLACWLADEAPVELYATGAALIDPAIGEAGGVDTSLLLPKKPGGGLCLHDNTRPTPHGPRWPPQGFRRHGWAPAYPQPTCQ